MRRPIIAANWKMNMQCREAIAFAEALLPTLASQDLSDVEIVIAPPFTALDRLRSALGGSEVQLAAQNVSPEAEGAFTGEISVAMLKELECRHAIVGHSERRAIFGESSELVARKAVALQAQGLRPIVCVGETLDQRNDGQTLDVVGRDLAQSLEGVDAGDGEEVVIAYEPVWAIGTGLTATPEAAQEVHAFIREQLGKRYGATGDAIRIQYGGSVKPDNALELLSQPDIDGALIGGAALVADSFSKIIIAAHTNFQKKQ